MTDYVGIALYILGYIFHSFYYYGSITSKIEQLTPIVSGTFDIHAFIYTLHCLFNFQINYFIQFCVVYIYIYFSNPILLQNQT